ncbi:hypothetical protein NASIATALIE_91 [Mycobacterium phage NaSiaTalie]|nr:hypothetical protein NASIATALIE_91 [Mycobacterium phage NaSiaTalie]
MTVRVKRIWVATLMPGDVIAVAGDHGNVFVSNVTEVDRKQGVKVTVKSTVVTWDGIELPREQTFAPSAYVTVIEVA